MKIYLASSWRNEEQPALLKRLRKEGHIVYDFRHPEGPDHSNKGFSWREIDPNWKNWSFAEYARALQWSSVAKKGYELDRNAIDTSDACVLLLPSGRSAAWELGYAMGKGKKAFIIQIGGTFEPELMFKEAHLCVDLNELLYALSAVHGALFAKTHNEAHVLPLRSPEPLRKCKVCGHFECPMCSNWCDILDDENPCACDDQTQCDYGSETRSLKMWEWMRGTEEREKRERQEGQHAQWHTGDDGFITIQHETLEADGDKKEEHRWIAKDVHHG
jgi:nucleoside 2-deoxyribosyltransferase